MKKDAVFLLAALLIVAAFPAWADDSAMATSFGDGSMQGFTYEAQEVAKPDAVNVSADNITREAIREQVRALRRQQYQRMPYMAHADVREAIDPEKVKKRMIFSQGDVKNLADIIQRAIDADLTAKAARERMDLSRRRIVKAVRDLFPEMSFEYEDEEGVLSTGKYNSRGYHLTVRQPIFRGGILWNTMLQEQAELKAAKQQHEKVVEDLINDVAAAYFEYNRALQVTRDHRDVLDRMQRYATISEQKFSGELISEIEHLNVQSLYSQMQYDFETAKQELELARLELQNYLDLGVNDSLQIAGLYDMDLLLDHERSGASEFGIYEDEVRDVASDSGLPALEDLVEMAYQNRAELQVESARLESARLRERIQWGELLPHADVLLEAGELGEALDANDLHPKKRKEWRLLLELKWNAWGNTVEYAYETDQNAPTATAFLGAGGTETWNNKITVNLFDGLEALAQVKEAEVEKLDQIVELENAEKEVVQDVKQAYFEYQKALIQLKSTIKRLDYRERLSRLSKHRLEQNEIQISEYLQAEIDLLQERQEIHQALKDYFAAKSALNRAVGVRNYLPIEEFYGQK